MQTPPTPPVCNYEGSDYQSSFWEKGGRAYEDACEAIALKKLLPAHGKHLLELGAGAGRNTPRYTGYEHVTLLDYSRTQLEQAHTRLEKASSEGAGEHLGYSTGASGTRYRYVAADVYRLPFVDGVFDGATMIRTLHHMADAPAALNQVRRVLAENATFILEYANKRNIKSMLRYLLGKQTWSPYTPDPVEYLPLNFDFHPATLRVWMKQVGFNIQRTLTVSHFRLGFLKRAIPTGFLAWLDSLAGLTGNLWQLTPSVFLRSNASGSRASESSTPSAGFFACPACRAPLEDTPPLIRCAKCGQTYPVIDGIYDFRLDVK